jgi:NADPH-dependent 2,4-dienoyl-CoA reductase/sulfur reductase-like enzyme
MRYVIVGGGLAGATAAQALRRLDAQGEVHLYAAEPYPYYFSAAAVGADCRKREGRRSVLPAGGVVR